jgi:hypothetical protein
MSQTVKIKLVHGQNVREVEMPAFNSFGQLKEVAHSCTGIPLQHIKLNFKGREKRDSDQLSSAGVKNGAKIFVGESEQYKNEVAAQREAEELAALQAEQAALLGAQAPRPSPAQASQPAPRAPRNAAQPLPSFESRVLDASGAPAAAPAPQPQPPPLTASERAANAIAKVAQEVSELEPQVMSLQPGNPAVPKDAIKLAEFLTQKLLVLDGIDVTPETRQLRKAQIVKINSLCDHLETLKTSRQQGSSEWTQF